MICKVKRGGNQGSDRKDPNKQTKTRERAKSCTTHSRKHTKHTLTHTHTHTERRNDTQNTREGLCDHELFSPSPSIVSNAAIVQATSSFATASSNRRAALLRRQAAAAARSVRQYTGQGKETRKEKKETVLSPGYGLTF